MLQKIVLKLELGEKYFQQCARPKIQSQSQIFKYGRSIFHLPHWPNFSDIFDLCLHWVSVVRAFDHRQKNLMCSENIEHTQKDHIDDSCLKNSVKQVKKVTSLIDLLPFIPQLFL